jgi:electron transfer flavoprotein beta subunit
MLAEELQLPCVSFVDAIEPASQGLLLRRQTDAGWERIQTTLPVVVTITNNEFNVPRIPKIRDIMQSKRQPITRWTLADLGLADLASETPASEVIDLVIPQKQIECQFVQGETLEEKVVAFARSLAQSIQGG